MGTQYFFDMDKVSNLYLSPYVDVYGGNGKKTLLLRRDTGSRVILEENGQKAVDVILSSLSSGVSRQTLIDLLALEDNSKAEMWIDMCIRNGMIE